MGFGFMFLGYILLLRTNVEFFGIPLDITPDVLGFFLMAHGFTVASKYCRCFDLSRLLSKIGIGVSFAVFTLDILSATKLFSLPAGAVTAISWIYSAFLISFTLCLLRSVYRIAEETGVEKIQKRATRNMLLVALLFFIEKGLLDVLRLFGVAVAEENMKYVTGVMFLAGAVHILLVAALIFSCYMWICLEGDEDMPDTRRHKYKTPFDYFDKGRESYANQGGKKKKHK